MKLLISGCLLGLSCRYDGGTKPMEEEKIKALMEKHELVPVCPEQLGGLCSPRLPSERKGYKVYMKDGTDVTENFMRGAEQALYLAKLFGCEAAVLKERSPSCGSGSVYDGSFTGVLTEGDGIAAELLKAKGITVYVESQLEELL